MLDLRSEKEAGYTVEGVGAMKVLASSSFAAPPSNIESEYRVKSLPGFGIRLPVGAWPEGDTRPLKLVVLDVKSDPTLAGELGKMNGAKFMGQGIYFEPSGIVFGKPVEIAIPFDDSDMGNLELNVHRHHPTKSFQKISLSSQRVSPIDLYSKTIFAETLSFSMYAPLATPLVVVSPAEEEVQQVENVTVAAAEPVKPTKGLSVGVIVAISVGSVAFVLLVLVIYCWCCRSSAQDEKTKPLVKHQESPSTQRGISQQEARANDKSNHDHEPTANTSRALPTSPEVPKHALKQGGDLEVSTVENAGVVTYSSRCRYAPQVPPPEEDAPVLQLESPRYADGATPPITPNTPIWSTEISLQVHMSPSPESLFRL